MTVTSGEVSGANDMAFPVLDREQTPNNTWQLGLTKREYIATMALQGILAHSYNDASYDGAARDAVIHADTLLQELAK